MLRNVGLHNRYVAYLFARGKRPQTRERVGLDGGPLAAVNRSGGVSGDRLIMRAAVAEAAFVESDGVDREVIAPQGGVAGEERVE